MYRFSTIIIVENVKSINDDTFDICGQLRCIYYHGKSEPNISSPAFTCIESINVMSLYYYNDITFGPFNVTKETTVEGYITWSTQTFTQSNLFSNSNIFFRSNAFTHEYIYSVQHIHKIKYIYNIIASMSIFFNNIRIIKKLNVNYKHTNYIKTKIIS